MIAVLIGAWQPPQMGHYYWYFIFVVESGKCLPKSSESSQAQLNRARPKSHAANTLRTLPAKSPLPQNPVHTLRQLSPAPQPPPNKPLPPAPANRHTVSAR